MTLQELRKLIKTTIDELALSELREIPKREEKRRKEMNKTKAQRMQDAEKALFFGMQKDEPDTKFSLNEMISGEVPQISVVEMEEFVKSFQEKLNNKLGPNNVAIVKFDVQPDSGQIMSFPQVSGEEIFLSGTIQASNSQNLKFSFSLQNGLKVSGDNYSIDDENEKISEALHELYNDWKLEWVNNLSKQDPEEQDAEIPTPETPDVEAPATEEGGDFGE